MIFKEKEYKILFKTLQKIGNEVSLYDIQNIFKDVISEKPPTNQELKDCIDKGEFNKLPVSNTLNEYLSYGMKNYKVNKWLYELDKKLFSSIHEEFEKNGIDLLTHLQEDLFTSTATANGVLNKHAGDRVTYINCSLNYLHYTCNNNASYKDNPEKEKIFNIVIENMVEMTSKHHHPYALGLIRKAIEIKEDHDKVINWFKSFIEINKTINPSAKKHMDFIKESIKDWDLKKYFKGNEIKLLYSNENGLIAKKTQGLYYEVDVNLIKAQTKASSGTIGANLRALTSAIDEVLGELPQYLKTIKVFNDPEIQFNILFDSDIAKHQVDAMDEIIKMTVNSKTEIKYEELTDIIKKTLYHSFLEEKLPEKISNETRKAKI